MDRRGVDESGYPLVFGADARKGVIEFAQALQRAVRDDGHFVCFSLQKNRIEPEPPEGGPEPG